MGGSRSKEKIASRACGRRSQNWFRYSFSVIRATTFVEWWLRARLSRAQVAAKLSESHDQLRRENQEVGALRVL